MIQVLTVLVLAGKIFPGGEEDIFSVMSSAGYDHFPHPGSYDVERRIYKDQMFIRRDVRRRICGDTKRSFSGIKKAVCESLSFGSSFSKVKI